MKQNAPVLCRELRQKLSAYFDGELSPLETAGAEGHLGSCQQCRGELESLSDLSEVLRVEGRRVPPAPAWEGLEARLRRSAPNRRVFVSLRRSALATAAALFLVLVSGGLQKAISPNIGDRHSKSRSPSDFVAAHEITFAGLPGLERLLASHQAVELAPEKIPGRLSFRPRLSPELPGGYRLARSYLIRDSSCTGVCLLYRRGTETIGVVQQPPSHPVNWQQGTCLRTEVLAGTSCQRVRLDGVDLIQIESEGANLILVTRVGSADAERFIGHLLEPGSSGGSR